ncbi:uncharacterized protein [Halyomorpha halys]|uniref:uncharacterized protein n=1 Tax=Halyomorpha halys TaxID=286706 RepID=UPI0006D4EC38|nr:uncharacterized protein LOC106678434 [Halyomorpha halys]
MIMLCALFLNSFLSAKTDPILSRTISLREGAPNAVKVNIHSPLTPGVKSSGPMRSTRKKCTKPQSDFLEKKKLRNKPLLMECRPPTPYCNFDKNICVGKIPSRFRCEADGHYPHIADCRGSILCSRGKETDIACSITTSYDYKSKSCVTGRRKCVIPNCTGRSEGHVRHPAGKNLYVSCLAGVPSALYACPPSYFYSFKSEEPCDLKCSYPGLYRHMYDKTKYYQCEIDEWNGEELIRLEKTCQEGTSFKQIFLACIPD